MRFNQYSGWGEGLSYFMVFLFFVILFIQSCMSVFPQLYLIFDAMFGQGLVWLQFLGATLIILAFEILFKFSGHYAEWFGCVGSDASKLVFDEAARYQRSQKPK